MARPQKVIPNPFNIEVEGEVVGNTLEDSSTTDLDSRLEDILIGAVGAFRADSHARNEYVNWKNVFYIYQQMPVITRATVQELLAISEAQAKRYAQVLNLASKLIKNHFIDRRTPSKGYVHLSTNQIRNGYLELL